MKKITILAKAHALCEFHSVFLCFLIFSVVYDYITAVNTVRFRGT